MPRTEREAALVSLLDSITPVMSAADELEPAARVILAAVCELTGWSLGHLYVADDTGEGFVSSGLWVGAVEEFPVLREVTARSRFTPGVGTIGQVAATGEPVWSYDVTRDPAFVRTGGGAELGVGAAFAFPVVAVDGVVAVLEFFAHQVIPRDRPLMRVMANLGHQLGQVVDRQRARQAADAERHRLEQMIETSMEAFVAMDATGRIADWNAAAERMFRLPREQALGRLLADTIVPPRHREAHLRGLARFLDTGRPKVLNQRFEITAWRLDEGEEFPVELVIWAVRDAGTWLFNSFLHDITDRRRAEDALRVAYEQEQATVARLRELDEAKGDFVATVSHELRTPLTTIIGYLEMLTDEEGPLPGRYERMLHVMADNAARLQHLVDDLLTVNAMNTGDLTVDSAPVAVREIVDRAVRSVGEEARARGSAVEVSVDPDGQRVEADLDHLVRALSALLSNAIKFSPPGAPVTVRASGAAETVTIEVTDTGAGIPADELPHVFEHFYRTRSATDQAVQGIGLGLTIARSIAEAHGGALTAASTPGHGSTFTLTLPVAGTRRTAREET
ncbi:ATP-binding protein [Planomonospora venezuelensis]|uniref:histidine kinase n=1 Tax=Planomonospora venezuelensis TaxID=1999 RepID=A0A841D9A4_PLAVE|nr:ATP-binding protein [Planomonospora venezuelensis]MBB5963986.1 PAS domain S-box-containing protein [Planomonospora venezuelensis]GIN05079.1 hypothetical protein Pve01_67370 [Planomonospora venezuelensis]